MNMSIRESVKECYFRQLCKMENYYSAEHLINQMNLKISTNLCLLKRSLRVSNRSHSVNDRMRYLIVVSVQAPSTLRLYNYTPTT